MGRKTNRIGGEQAGRRVPIGVPDGGGILLDHVTDCSKILFA